MGKLEGKGRRAGFLKAFECVIYIPIHTIYASIYVSFSSKQNTRLSLLSPHSVILLKQWDSDSSLFQTHD